MAHTVKLTKNHKRILLEAIIYSMEIKESKLKKPDSIEQMHRYYNDAAQKIVNIVECGSTKKNLFTWLKDQFYHTTNFDKTEFGQLAIAICDAAASNTYESYCRMTIMNTLFE